MLILPKKLHFGPIASFSAWWVFKRLAFFCQKSRDGDIQAPGLVEHSWSPRHFLLVKAFLEGARLFFAKRGPMFRASVQRECFEKMSKETSFVCRNDLRVIDFFINMTGGKMVIFFKDNETHFFDHWFFFHIIGFHLKNHAHQPLYTTRCIGCSVAVYVSVYSGGGVCVLTLGCIFSSFNQITHNMDYIYIINNQLSPVASASPPSSPAVSDVQSVKLSLRSCMMRVESL